MTNTNYGIHIGSLTAIDCGAVASVPADIGPNAVFIGKVDMVRTGVGVLVRDQSGVLRALGLPETAPIDAVVSLLKAIRPEMTVSEVQTEAEGLGFGSKIALVNDVASLAKTVWDVAQSDILRQMLQVLTGA